MLGPMDENELDRHPPGEVDVITINRPEVRNALAFKTYDQLEHAVRTTTARCLVITGADPAFCSGDDVRAVMGGGERADRPVIVSPRLTRRPTPSSTPTCRWWPR